MFENPSSLVISSIIGAFCQGIIPREEIVQIISVVIDCIAKFDKKDSDISHFLHKKLAGLNKTVVLLIKSHLWRLECIDDFHNYFDELSRAVVNDFNDAGCARPLRTNSVLGGFVQDMVFAFKRLDFDKRCQVWDQYVCYRKEHFKISLDLTPDKSLVVESPPAAVMSSAPATDDMRIAATFTQKADVQSAIGHIRRFFDQGTDREPQHALGCIFQIMKFNGYVDRSLETAEQLITAARSCNDKGLIIDTIAETCLTIHEYPDAIPPAFVGAKLGQIIEYLMSEAVESQDPSRKFRCQLAQLVYLRDRGASLTELTAKLESLLHYYAQIPFRTEFSLAYHHECFQIWTLCGKSALAQCHFSIFETLCQRAENPDVAAVLPQRTLILIQRAMQGFSSQSLERLEILKPAADHVREFQHWKVAKLLLRVVHLTQTRQFHAASKVLEVLEGFPLKSMGAIKPFVKFAAIQLQLAQEKNWEALQMTGEALAEASSLDRFQYLLLSARALFSLGETSQKTRRFQVLETARQCQGCNSVPLVLEAMTVEASALMQSSTLEDLMQAKKLCETLLPALYSMEWPRLLSEACIVYTTCLLHLFYAQSAELAQVVDAFNKAQLQLNEHRDYTTANNQLHELRQDLLKENAQGLLESRVKPANTSTITLESKSVDLKRKSSTNERRPSKKRRSLLLPF